MYAVGMDENHINALLLPVSSHGSATYQSTVMGEAISSNSGLPAITFNIGYTKNNMPIGVELIGRKFHERELIEMAYAFEQGQPRRMKPTMPPANKTFESMDISQYNNLISQYTQYFSILILLYNIKCFYNSSKLSIGFYY